MVNGTATLVVDLGNSDTRVLTYFGKTSKGEHRKKLSVVSNRYSEIPEDRVESFMNNENYSDDNSRIFKIDDGTYYTNGLLCNREYGTFAQRPSATSKKYESLITKLTLINAFRKGYEDVATFTNSDMSSVDVDWKVVVELPPADVESGAAKIAEMVKSIKEIDFCMPEIKKEISIQSVNVFPEGFCALIATIFESKEKIRPEYAYLLDESSTTLILDIGAGTSDLLLSVGNKIMQNSRFTLEIGGNNVHQIVRGLLKQKEGIELPDNLVRKGCEKGFIMYGGKKVDIKDLIREAKSDVSKTLINGVIQFFESKMIPIHTINNILVVGGGACESDVEGINPISDYVVDYITQRSKYISRVELPKQIINGEESQISPRLLNIIGAGILAE